MARAWVFWEEAQESVRILDRNDLWGSGSIEVLRPSDATVHVLPASSVVDVGQRAWSSDEVAYRAAAARAHHLAVHGEPFAIAAGKLEPLPHQLSVLDRALQRPEVRLLLADEVGLGKTIEAGLIYSELKARRRLRRVLVVAPRGVQLQWVAEMKDRFGEEFVLVGPEGLPVDSGIDVWKSFDRVVCSMDAVKPIKGRRGWSPEKVTSHNESRFRSLIEAGWDLVIVDEAHHVAGSTEEVARHRLAAALSRVCRHLLLLSATPHSGKSENFGRLIGLLTNIASNAVPNKEELREFIVRTEKREAVDAQGRALFQPRSTFLETVPYGDRVVERKLYEAVTDYVRHGYARARQEKRPALGFLVLLMQRLVSSSTAAIEAALEKRLATLTPGRQLTFFVEGIEEWGELSGEDQFDALARTQGEAWGDERREVELLLELARRARGEGADTKASFLLDLVRRVQREEGNPEAKVLVFTEFRQTQEMLLDLLDSAGITTTSINGDMGLEERRAAQEEFRDRAQVLVSTDAGGEGINLQFAHVVVNYDLPWNPMKIEQRIGRVDRIGQEYPVRAYNLILENSVDERVLEVLEEKLWNILRELGADKWGDVLETVSAGRGVEHVYARAITEPDRVDDEVAAVVESTKADLEQQAPVLETLREGRAEPRTRESRIGETLESAATWYERWRGESLDPWDLRLPETAAGESIPEIHGETKGLWSLWEVGPDGLDGDRDFFALFTDATGSVRPDLAERMWMELTEGPAVVSGSPLQDEESEALIGMGRDYAYRPAADLKPSGDFAAPYLKLRLVVRSRP